MKKILFLSSALLILTGSLSVALADPIISPISDTFTLMNGTTMIEQITFTEAQEIPNTYQEVGFKTVFPDGTNFGPAGVLVFGGVAINDPTTQVAIAIAFFTTDGTGLLITDYPESIQTSPNDVTGDFKIYNADGTPSTVATDLIMFSAGEPTSVPEPSSLLMMGTGLASLWVLRRKKFISDSNGRGAENYREVSQPRTAH